MHRRTFIPRKGRHRRGGLAPLELVLYLPLMLFVMALMVNIGVVGGWKIRTQLAARYAGWRTLHSRTGQSDPDPANFRQRQSTGGAFQPTASIRSSSGSAIEPTRNLWNGDARLRTPEIRGSQIREPSQGRTILVPGRLEMPDGVHNGHASLDRQTPLMANSMVPSTGRYQFELDHNLLDHRWEFHDLGYGSNSDRRAKRWWQIDPTPGNLPELAGDLAQFQQAYARLASNPDQANLDVLDRDDEFIRYRGFPPPDFHPTIGGLCTEDMQLVRNDSRFQQLLDRITRLPGSMSRAFIGLYQQEINRLQALQPPPTQEIQRLETLVEQLNQFLGSLPMKHR